MIPVTEWISNCIELERNSNKTDTSLWKELYEFGQVDDKINHHLPMYPEEAAPVTVYVTGKIDGIREKKGPFYHLQEPNDLVYLIYGEEDECADNSYIWKRPDSLLRYLTICYVPQNKIKCVQKEIKRFIVFTVGKPEIWMRNLLKKSKVAGLLGWEDQIDPTWYVSWSASYRDFSYALFLKDDVNFSSRVKKSAHFCPNIPSGLKLGLQRALRGHNDEQREQLWREALDLTAMQMLEEYWLYNALDIKEFVPELVKKVIEYHHIRSIPPNETSVIGVEESFKKWLQ